MDDPGLPNPTLYTERHQFTIFDDTLISGIDYKRLFITNYDSIALPVYYIGALREDSIGRVFFIKSNSFQLSNLFNHSSWHSDFNDSTECILYDFTLQVGDTLNTPNLAMITRIVMSIDSVSICGTFRKRINFYSFYDSWLEGIGSTKGFFFPALYEFESGFKLHCYEDTGCFWLDPQTPDCFTVDMDDLVNETTGITLYPNPASDYINVRIDERYFKNDRELLLFNSLGQQVKKIKLLKNKDLHTVDISNFKNGIYCYRLSYDSNKIRVGKFFKLMK
ncbi:T9SS type A sorting domain-containing protein [candidate division KSB1 bacterium]